MVGAINDTCTEDDHLWVAGDLWHWTCGADAAMRVSEMAPHVHLVTGNHDAQVISRLRGAGVDVVTRDDKAGLIDTSFPSAFLTDTAPDGSRRGVFVCHYPLAVPTPSADAQPTYDVFGHLHAGRNRDGTPGPRVEYVQELPRALNASADVLADFAPTTLDGLIAANAAWRRGEAPQHCWELAG